jgi:hypothetical protein
MEKVSNKNPFVRFKPREIQIAQHQMNSKKVICINVRVRTVKSYDLARYAK